MIGVLFLLQLTFVAVPAAAVIFEDCGSAYELYAVNIDGCGWSLPCYVTLGEETPVEFKFLADFSSNLLDQNVFINVNLVNVNADVTPDNCVTVECPVKTGAINSFSSVLSVPNIMALNQRGYLHWRVYNEREQLVICYSVLVQTQSLSQRKIRELLKRIIPEHANDIVDNLPLDRVISDGSLNIDSELTAKYPTQSYLKKLIDKYFEQKMHLETITKID